MNQKLSFKSFILFIMAWTIIVGGLFFGVHETLEHSDQFSILAEDYSDSQSLPLHDYFYIRSDSYCIVSVSEVRDAGVAKEVIKQLKENVYNSVMGKLLDGESGANGPNGFYILSMLVLLVSLLSQYISRRTTSPKDKSGKPVAQPGAGKFMMLLLPAIMVVFTLSSNAVFSIYILTNSLVSTLLVPATTAISNEIITKQEKKKQNLVKVDYRR